MHNNKLGNGFFVLIFFSLHKTAIFQRQNCIKLQVRYFCKLFLHFKNRSNLLSCHTLFSIYKTKGDFEMIAIKKADLWSAEPLIMVPSARLELAREVPQDSKSCVYTSFTTKALPGAPEGIQTLGLEIRNLTLYSSELQRHIGAPDKIRTCGLPLRRRPL